MATQPVEQITLRLMDEGKIIEAGWMSYRLQVMPQHAHATQVDETRKAFYAGAQHLYVSIMTALEPGAQPTDADLRRLDQISAELLGFLNELKASMRVGIKG